MPAHSQRWAFSRGLALLIAVAGLGLAGPASAQDAKPKRKDTPARLVPKEVTFKAEVTPKRARAGATVTYKVTATVKSPWHIYAYTKTPPDQGPSPTTFDFYQTSGLKADGDWTPSKKPIQKKEPAFPDLPFVEFYQDEVTWSIPLMVPANAAAGPKVLRSQVNFQICDPKQCLPPTRVSLPAVTVEVFSVPSGGSSPGGMAALIGAATVAVTPPPVAVAGEVEQSIDKGLISFLLVSALGGLLAILMPCVWPMVPITVNFFVKQGQARQGRTTGLAITYCLSIIGIYTAIGLLATLLLGEGSTTALGSNPWLNLIFAAVFIALGLSLLGLFEVRLPSSWLNASSKAEGRGGLIGVMFMAVTLTITSFTCTAPVVGSLLVLAARGHRLYATLGLLTFSTVLSLPFLLLALAPGLLAKMPKSGDWMNAVKVVGGLLEIAAAFKFINVAEVSFRGVPEGAFFDAEALLAIWVVTALVCGLYLLGLFRTDHDHDAIRVGPVRLLSGTMFLSVALYLAPALFGYPPQSKGYQIVAGILPGDYTELDMRRSIAELIPPAPAVALVPGAPGSEAPIRPTQRVKATSNDPEVAIRQERTVHGVGWGLSYEAALEEARKTNRPVLIDFTGVQCANCRTMEASVMPHRAVRDELHQFITVQLYTDFVPIETLNRDQKEDLGVENRGIEMELVNSIASPTYVILNPDGKVVTHTAFDQGYVNNPAKFAQFLREARAKAQSKGQVAGVM